MEKSGNGSPNHIRLNLSKTPPNKRCNRYTERDNTPNAIGLFNSPRNVHKTLTSARNNNYPTQDVTEPDAAQHNLPTSYNKPSVLDSKARYTTLRQDTPAQQKSNSTKNDFDFPRKSGSLPNLKTRKPLGESQKIQKPYSTSSTPQSSPKTSPSRTHRDSPKTPNIKKTKIPRTKIPLHSECYSFLNKNFDELVDFCYTELERMSLNNIQNINISEACYILALDKILNFNNAIAITTNCYQGLLIKAQKILISFYDMELSQIKKIADSNIDNLHHSDLRYILRLKDILNLNTYIDNETIYNKYRQLIKEAKTKCDFIYPQERCVIATFETLGKTPHKLYLNIPDNQYMVNLNMSKAQLNHIKVENKDLMLRNFTEANLSFSIMINSNLCSSNFTNADLTQIDLSGATCIAAIMRNTTLIKATLIGTNLSGACLVNAILIGSNLANANLTDANLYKAKLNNSNLTKATLIGCNFNGADITGADFTDAIFDQYQRITLTLFLSDHEMTKEKFQEIYIQLKAAIN
ncbi:MAG: pentapeptide repeat-containing protein, partial [Neisseriaceae bacterium]